jgi:hypothetical protein
VPEDLILIRRFDPAKIPHGVCRSSDPVLQTEGMDKTIQKYRSLDEMKADEYRYWQSRPGHERMRAVAEITLTSYAMKGVVPDVPRLQRTLVHLQRPQR